MTWLLPNMRTCRCFFKRKSDLNWLFVCISRIGDTVLQRDGSLNAEPCLGGQHVNPIGLFVTHLNHTECFALSWVSLFISSLTGKQSLWTEQQMILKETLGLSRINKMSMTREKVDSSHHVGSPLPPQYFCCITYLQHGPKSVHSEVSLVRKCM